MFSYARLLQIKPDELRSGLIWPHHARLPKTNPKTTIFLTKTIHFAPHTRGKPKGWFCGVAKRIKVLDGRSCIFQKKYAFRCSVVTLMCVPPMQNRYLFWESSDLLSKIVGILANSQNQPLGFPPYGKQNVWFFIMKMVGFGMIWGHLMWCS